MKSLMLAAALAALAGPAHADDGAIYCTPERLQIVRTFVPAFQSAKGNTSYDTAMLKTEMADRKDEADAFLRDLGLANYQARLRGRAPEMSCADGLKLATAYMLGE